MMETIRGWLIGITATAMIAALAENIAPEGSVKRIVKFAGGLLMIIAMIRPVMHLDFSNLSSILTDYHIDSAGYSKALETKNSQLIKSIIEDETSAYIQDKAAQAGASCSVEVVCMCDDAGNLYPGSVCVTGDLTETQTEALRRLIESDLAIPAQNQQYERTQSQ